MNNRLKIEMLGTGVYHLTRKDAGEAYKAARKHRVKGDVTFWRRPRGKASK
jgi:hypothetical protein